MRFQTEDGFSVCMDQSDTKFNVPFTNAEVTFEDYVSLANIYLGEIDISSPNLLWTQYLLKYECLPTENKNIETIYFVGPKSWWMLIAMTGATIYYIFIKRLEEQGG